MPVEYKERFGEYYGQNDPSSSGNYHVQHCRRLECWRVQVQLFDRCRRLPVINIDSVSEYDSIDGYDSSNVGGTAAEYNADSSAWQ